MDKWLISPLFISGLFRLTSVGSWLLPHPSLSTLSLPTGLPAVFSLQALLEWFFKLSDGAQTQQQKSIHRSLSLLIAHLPTGGEGPRTHVCLQVPSSHQCRTQCLALNHPKAIGAHKPTGLLNHRLLHVQCAHPFFAWRLLNHPCSSCYKHW